MTTTAKSTAAKPAAKKTTTAATTAKTTTKAAAKKPATRKAATAKAATTKPAARKPATRKPAAKRTTAKPSAPAQPVAAPLAGVTEDHAIRAWFDRLVEFDFELPSIDLSKVELPTFEFPNVELPSFGKVQLPTPDEVRLTMVRALDGVQDAVMTAPSRAQEIVVDFRESVTKSVVLLREAVGL